MKDIIIQEIGFLGLFAFICSYQIKSNKRLFLMQMIGVLLFSLQFLLMGAYSGCLSLFLTAIRNIMMSKYKEWNRLMDLVWFLTMGLIGSVLMFSGDMALYYSKDDYETDGTLLPVINIMKNVSKGRLYYGAMIGPVAAFAYCIGYYHIVKMMNGYSWVGWIGFLCGSLGIIIGGAYHSHWVYFGRLGKLGDKEAVEEVIAFCKIINSVSYGIIGAGFLVILIALAFGLTILPRWVAIFSPGVLFLLMPLIKKLPKGLHMIICGGWSNLISVIYYIVTIVTYIVIS